MAGDRSDDPGHLTRRPHNRVTSFVWGAIIVILVIVVAIVVYAVAGPPESSGTVRRAPTSEAVVSDVAHVPPSVFNAIGITPTSTAAVTVAVTPPSVVNGAPLLSMGKPEVLYIGAEYCPFCGAERWPLVVALSRFGHFATLTNMQSAALSVFPGIQSFSFVGSTYASRYVTFTGVELYSNAVDSNGAYTRIATLTPAQSSLFTKYGAPATTTGGSPSFPFVDVANGVVASTSGFSPALIANMSQSAIASALDQPTQPSTQAIVASANYLTAGICRATRGQPGSVCTSKGVRSALAALRPGEAHAPLA
jgi:hypothetical protein